jgi:calcineurin-like phosphoesterase family protein
MPATGDAGSFTGHSHGKLPPYGASFDVGVNCYEFQPLSWETVRTRMEALEANEQERTRLEP